MESIKDNSFDIESTSRIYGYNYQILYYIVDIMNTEKLSKLIKFHRNFNQSDLLFTEFNNFNILHLSKDLSKLLYLNNSKLS